MLRALSVACHAKTCGDAHMSLKVGAAPSPSSTLAARADSPEIFARTLQDQSVISWQVWLEAW